MLNKIKYKKKKEVSWIEDDMRDALIAVEEKKMNICKASKHYNIPKSTLLRHLQHHDKPWKVGAPMVLSAAEEAEILYETCQTFASWGFGLMKEDIINVVAEFVKYHKRHNVFTNGMPGDDWWVGFLRRHPDLVRRKPQQLQMVRAKAAMVEVVNHWFIECLKPTLEQLG